LIILLSSQISCSIFNSIQEDPNFQQTSVKYGLKVSVSVIRPNQKDLEKIYEINGITPKELETNELIFIKIKYENQSPSFKDIYTLSYKLWCKENNLEKDYWIDSDQKGFIIPSENVFKPLDRLIKIESKKSLIGYLPFWIPKNTRIFSLSIMDQRSFPDTWCFFSF